MPVHSPDTPSLKVVAATAGAGVGTVTANLVIWGLNASVFPHGTPEPVAAFVMIAVPAVLAFVGGYFTRRSAAEVASLQQAPVSPTVAELIDAHSAPAPAVDVPAAPVKKAAAKKTAAKRPAKKAAPKVTGD